MVEPARIEEKPDGLTSADPRPRVLLLGMVLAGIAYFFAGWLPFPDSQDLSIHPARVAAAVAVLTATCWLGRAIALGAASLLPLALLPLLGGLPVDRAATAYAHPILWLFFGGFVLAIGVERWGLHRRLALNMIRVIGVNPSRLVFGFMVAGACLSMWLSNTATALLLYPIAMALVRSLIDADAVERSARGNFSFALLLGIAYGCSVGGVATPIGTPTNALFLSNYEHLVDEGAPPIGFLTWVMFALPITLILVPVIWLFLTRVVAPVPSGHPEAKRVIDEEIRALGSMSTAEKRMAMLFGLVAILWVTRQDFDLGEFGVIPGWWRLLPVASARAIGDGSVAVFVALLAFIVPSGRKQGETLMNWESAKRMPWEILYLLGGGILIARSFAETGLSEAVSLAMRPIVAELHPLGMILFIAVFVTFLTEVTSNTAIVALLLPVLASMAAASDIDPRLLMIPATFSASCAFMLPIATPPNAIVFASGQVPMGRMARTGFWINLIGAVVITLVTWFVVVPLLGIDPSIKPDW